MSGTIGIFDYVSRSAFDGARGTLFGISECALLNGVYFVNHFSMLLNILHAFRAHRQDHGGAVKGGPGPLNY